MRDLGPKNSRPVDASGRIARLVVQAFLRAILMVPGPELFDIFEELSRSRSSIDQKVLQATQALRNASDLVKELESDLQGRTEKLEYLRTQVERYSILAEIEEDKAKSLLSEVQVVVNKGKNVERFISLAINLLAGLLLFVFGVIAAPKVKEWIGIETRPLPTVTQDIVIPSATNRQPESSDD